MRQRSGDCLSPEAAWRLCLGLRWVPSVHRHPRPPASSGASLPTSARPRFLGRLVLREDLDVTLPQGRRGPPGPSGELCAVRGGGRPELLLSAHVVFVTMPTEPACSLSASKTSGLSKAPRRGLQPSWPDATAWDGRGLRAPVGGKVGLSVRAFGLLARWLSRFKGFAMTCADAVSLRGCRPLRGRSRPASSPPHLEAPRFYPLCSDLGVTK